MAELLKELNKSSVFGRCDSKDIVTAGIERKNRERKAQIEREKKEEEALQRMWERKKQEDEDLVFAQQEEERLNNSKRNNYISYGRGRMHFSPPEHTPLRRGRGRIDKSQHGVPFFDKEIAIKSQIQLANGYTNFHNNQVQKEYWHGKSTPTLEERFQICCAVSENFEDAERSPNSSSNSSTELFKSCSSTASNSPIPAISPLLPTAVGSASPSPPPQPSPVKTGAVRKRGGSRLAAKFSNALEEEGNNNRSSEVYCSAQPSTAPLGLREHQLPRGGISINSLDPTMRNLNNGGYCYNKIVSDVDDYIYNTKDFPPL